MFLQTGGGGKGIRPNQQHQQQQHHHQSHHQSHHQTHHPHAPQQQQPSVHHGHPVPQQTHSHHPHQQAQQQQQQQQQQAQQQAQHHHPPPPISYYPYQLSQAPPPAQHPQAQNNAVQGTQMAPSPPTQASNATGSTSTVSNAQSHGMVGGGGGNVGGNSSSATNIARQHAAAAVAAAAAAAAGGNANMQHYSTSTALMQPPPTSTAFMTTTYLQQYHQQSAAVIAAAAAAAQYNNNAVAAAAAANNHGAPGSSQTSTLYQQQQQQHHQALHHPQTSLHTHYYHPSAGAAPTPQPHLHQHHHPPQHQLRGVITAPPHQRQATYLLPANAIFALPPGPLAAPRTSLLTAGTHQQGGTTGGAMPVTPLLQSGARAGTGGPTAYITPPFCQPPLPMGAAGLTPPQPLLATAASMTAPPLQTYGHLTGAATSTSSSTTSLSAASSAGGSGGGGSSTTENVKQRKYAIPIIHPITHENILDPKPQKKSTAVEAKPTATDMAGGAATDQQSGGAGSVPTSISQPKENDKSITVSIAKVPSATLTAAAAAATTAGVVITPTSAPDASVYAVTSKEKIDQQIQTDAVRDKNASASRGPTLDPHATDSSPAISTASGGEEGDDYTSGDLKTPRTDLDSDGNDLYANDEEQITVVVEELATNASTGRAEAMAGDDDASNYDDVESTSIVDVANDQDEDEDQTEAYDDTKEVQSNASFQQQQVAMVGESIGQRQHESELVAKKFESVGTTASLGSHVAEASYKEQHQQQPLQQKSTHMSFGEIVQRPRSSSHQNTMPTVAGVTILTSSAAVASNVPATLTTSSGKPQLRITKSTTIATMTTSTSAGGGCSGSTVPSGGKASQKFSPTTSGASSSATSTPTHQQQQQQQQQHSQHQQPQKKSAAATGNIMNAPSAANSAAGSANLKKNRKATKRAKESQKKLKQSENSNRSNSSSSSNNNNNNVNNNKSALGANSSLNNNIAVAAASTATATPSSILTDMNNANSYSGSSNNRGILRETASTANLRQQQQPYGIRCANNSNNNTKSGCTTAVRSILSKEDSKSESLSDDPTVSSMRTTSPATQRKHVKTQEIVSQFLQPPHLAGKTPEEQQLQFLNSSSSACEDDEEINARLQMQLQQQDAAACAAAVQDLRFGDFAEKKEIPSELGQLKSNTTTKVNTHNKSKSSTLDTVDCSANSNLNSSGSFNIRSGTPTMKLMNKVFSNSASGGGGAGMNAGPTSVAPTLSSKPRKYTLEELKALSKTADARKPPMVLCQKGDCISQLFVSRQQHHHMSHHAHNMSSLAMHPHLQQQQYQHMNFNESMELVTGKRRGGQAKKHHEHQAGAVGGVGGGGGSGVGGGGVGAGGSGSSAQAQRKMDFIRVQLSLKEEIKLSECENAWQPEPLRSKSAGSTTSGSNDDIDAVLKKVRGVLNKLTPDNFDVLLKTMTSISMNTQEKMQQVMLLIFEKTISEPNFAPTYAKFCKVLFQEIKAESKSLFSNSLITRIQQEFETNVNDADAKKIKLQPLVDKLDGCTDPKERLELQAELEDKEYQFRRRAWGTVRFIGEMYKLQSLTSDRVLICIESLLEHGCEEKLEYMCKLLTTVGHLLEVTAPEHYSNARMDKIFRRIQEIVQKSRGGGGKSGQLKISSRVRFMMQDVMDLRARCWDQPQNQSQVQQQQQASQQQQQRRNALSTKQDEKMQSGGGGGGINIYEKSGNRLSYSNQNNPRQGRDGGGGGHYFQQKSQKSQFMQQQEQQKLNIDVNKLKFSSDEVTQSTPKLGDSMLYLWRTPGRQATASGSGATSTTSSLPSSVLNATQQHAAVNSSGFKRQTPATLISLTTNPFQALDKQDKSPQPQMHNQGSTAAMDQKAVDDDDAPGYTSKECQKLLNRLIEEVLDASSSWQEEALSEWRAASTKQQVSLLHYLLMDYLHLAMVKRPQRMACATIFAHLMRTKAFNKSVFTQAYAQMGDEFPDLLVDVPNGWTYVFEFLGPILHEHLLHFGDIWLSQWAEDVHFTKRFLKAMIGYFTSEFGATYMRDLWHKEFKLERGEEFLADAAQWREFVSANGFQYIYDHNTKPPQTDPVKAAQHSTAEQVERIEFLLNTATGCDLAIDYINTNVYINTNFIRSLTKLLCCDYATVMASGTSMATAATRTSGSAATAAANATGTATGCNSSSAATKRQLNTERFRQKCTPLLRRCLDGRESHEIVCLDAIVDAMQQFYDDATSNQLIFSVFDMLYDSEVIPKESFEKWYRSRLAAEEETAAGAAKTSTDGDSSAANGGPGGGGGKPMSSSEDEVAGASAATKPTSTGATSKRVESHKGSSRATAARLSNELHAYMEKLL